MYLWDEIFDFEIQKRFLEWNGIRIVFYHNFVVAIFVQESEY